MSKQKCLRWHNKAETIAWKSRVSETKKRTFNHIGLKLLQTWHRTGDNYVSAKWKVSKVSEATVCAVRSPIPEWFWWVYYHLIAINAPLFGCLRPLDGILIVAFKFYSNGKLLRPDCVETSRSGTSTCAISFNLFFIHFEPDTDTHLDADIFSISIRRRRCVHEARNSLHLIANTSAIRSTRMSSFLVIYFRFVSMRKWTKENENNFAGEHRK